LLPSIQGREGLAVAMQAIAPTSFLFAKQGSKRYDIGKSLIEFLTGDEINAEVEVVPWLQHALIRAHIFLWGTRVRVSARIFQDRDSHLLEIREDAEPPEVFEDVRVFQEFSRKVIGYFRDSAHEKRPEFASVMPEPKKPLFQEDSDSDTESDLYVPGGKSDKLVESMMTPLPSLQIEVFNSLAGLSSQGILVSNDTFANNLKELIRNAPEHPEVNFAFGNMLAQMATNDPVSQKLAEVQVWEDVIDNIEGLRTPALKMLHKAFQEQAKRKQSSSIYSDAAEKCRQQRCQERSSLLSMWEQLVSDDEPPRVAYAEAQKQQENITQSPESPETPGTLGEQLEISPDKKPMKNMTLASLHMPGNGNDFIDFLRPPSTPSTPSSPSTASSGCGQLGAATSDV